MDPLGLFSVASFFAAGAFCFFIAAAADGFIVFCILFKVAAFVAAVAAVAIECYLEVLLEECVNQSRSGTQAYDCTNYDKQSL